MVMHMKDDEIRDLLVSSGRIDDAKITELIERSINEKTDLKSIIFSENIISEQELAELLARPDIE